MANQNILQKDPITNPEPGKLVFYAVDKKGTPVDGQINDQELKSFLGLNDSIRSNIPTQYIFIDVDYDPTDTDAQEREKVYNAIFARPNVVVKPNHRLKFVTYRSVVDPDGIDGTGVTQFRTVRTFYDFDDAVPLNAAGVASIGQGGTLVNGDQYEINKSRIQDSRSSAPNYVDLGNIGLQAVNDAVNSSGPYGFPCGSINLIRALQRDAGQSPGEETERFWYYTNCQFENVGNPASDPILYLSTIDDYLQLPSDVADGDGPDSIETVPLQSGSVGQFSNFVVDFENHEKRLYALFGSYDYESQNIEIGRLATGGQVVIDNIDTTGKTRYPRISSEFAFEVDGEASNTGNINIEGVNYLVTFNTSNNQTAEDFVTDHASAILSSTGIVVTSSESKIVLKGYMTQRPTESTNESFLQITTSKFAELIDSLPFEEGKRYDLKAESFRGSVKYWFTPLFIVEGIGSPSAVDVTYSSETVLKSLNVAGALDELVKRNYVVSITDFGAVGDGVQLDDWSITGSTLSSPSVTVSSADIGKLVSIADAGPSGGHLVTTIQSVDTGGNTFTLTDAATSNVSNVKGTYCTPNMKPIQDTFDFAIANNYKVVAPAGNYVIEDENPDNSSLKQVRINFTADNQNLYFEGAGSGLTVFTDLDGKNQRIGNDCTIFYCNLPASISVGKIVAKGMSFDKNGRSITVNPPSLFGWGQSSCFRIVKSSTAASTMQRMSFDDIEIIDKIGGGIAVSSGNYTVGSVALSDITARDFGGNDGPILYGQRGDIEMHAICDNMTYNNITVDYMQYELSGSYGSNSTRRRVHNIGNSYIKILEMTEPTGLASDVKYHVLNMEKVRSDNFTFRGLTVNAVNCSRLKISQTVNSNNGQFTDCNIYVPYNDVADSVGTLTFVNYTNIKNRCQFLNSPILIDSDDPGITPSGYAVTHSGSLLSNDDNYVGFFKCLFDSRFESSINAVNKGTWQIEECIVAGSVRVYNIGATGSNTSRLITKNNDYSQVPDGTLAYFLSNGNTNWTAVFNERVPQAKWQSGTSLTTGNTDVQIEVFPTLLIDDIANRTNFKRKGEVFEVTVAAAAGYKYYQVTTSGAGGSAVVKGFGLLEA